MGAEAAFHEHQVKTQLRRCCLSYCKTYQQWEEKKNHSFTIKNKKRIFKKRKTGRKKGSARFLEHLSESGASSGLPAGLLTRRDT